MPGYAAPQATIGPAARVGVVLCRIVADGVAAGVVDRERGGRGRDPAPGPRRGGVGLPGRPRRVRRRPRRPGLDGLFGLISFELFGHTHNVVVEHEEFFHDAVERLGDLLGLPRWRGEPVISAQAVATSRPSTSATSAGGDRALAQHPRLVAGQVDDRRRHAHPDGPPSR